VILNVKNVSAAPNVTRSGRILMNIFKNEY